MRRLTFLRRFSGPTRLVNLCRTGMNQVKTPQTKLRKILMMATTAMIMKIMMTNLTVVILIILTTIRVMRIKPQTKLLPRMKLPLQTRPPPQTKLPLLMKLHMKKQPRERTATACGF